MIVKTFLGEMHMPEQILITILEDLLNGTISSDLNGYYIGGTLMVDYNNHGTGIILVFNIDGYKEQAINKLVAKLYIANKTPTHCFYKRAMDIIAEEISHA